jgi:DNA repair exonuclease SbcCD ATPase subunit
MLREVAKGTPLIESGIGRKLNGSLDAMRDAAFGLENGAVHLAQDDSEQVVDALNSVVIDLLRTSQSMSSCPSGMPMSGLMQQLKELSGDQQKLNEALQQLMKEGGMSMDHRLQGKMDALASEQRRIQEQLEQLLEEMGSGQGVLGRLDDVEKKLDETAQRLEKGDVDDQLLEDQAWALTRLLDSQRSMRERELGKERQSKTGEDMADLTDPGQLPKGLEELDRDLREDLLKALDRRYPPKYEELIRRYFRSLSDEPPAPDLP